MLYVGLTEDHKESATMFANVVGTQVLSQFEALGSNTDKAANSKIGKSYKVSLIIFSRVHASVRQKYT